MFKGSSGPIMLDDQPILSQMQTVGLLGYQGHFHALFEEIKTSPSSTRARIFKSIVEDDILLLQSCMEARHQFEEDFCQTDLISITALHLACYYERLDAVRILLKHQNEHNYTENCLSTLAFACMDSKLGVIEVILQNGTDVLVKTLNGNTILHIIARLSTVEVVELLFDKHNIAPPVDDRDGHCATPLHYAAHRGHEKLCMWLLSKGANPRAMDGRQMTPFMYASRSGQACVITLMVTTGGCTLQTYLSDVDDESMTAFHLAVAEGRKQVTELLLSMGAHVNALTDQGSMPIHLCAASDHADLVPILVLGGAFLEARDRSGRTPLHRATENGSINAALSLIQEGADINSQDAGGTTPLSLACSKGYVDLVDMLLGLGADYTLANNLSRSCLHYAVEEGHLEVVELLLQKCHRSFAAIQDMIEMNALHIAAAISNKLVDVLIEYDELVNVPDILGRLPLHHAARTGTPETVESLATKTKDIDHESEDYKTPFFHACESGNRESIWVLKKHGADINTRDLFDRSTLMMAASHGSTCIVRDLISFGVDVNNMDKTRNTPLHYASANGHLSTVKVLVEHGASVKITNLNGRYPFLEAVEGLHCDIAKFFMAHKSWEDSLSVSGNPASIVNTMIRFTPEAVQVMLDKCIIKSNHPPHDQRYKIQFFYKYVDPAPDKQDSSCKCAVETMAQYKREDLLAHPVCQSMLALKWKTFGRFGLWLGCFLQATFYTLLCIFIFCTPKLGSDLDENGCNPKVTNNQNISVNVTEATQENESEQAKFIYYVVIALYVCLGISLVKEIRFMAAVGWRYIISLHNLLSLVSTAFVYYTLTPPGQELCATDWRLVIVATILINIKSCLIFLSIDSIGLYFSMFLEVLRGIAKISCLLVFFTLCFSLPFSVILRHQPGFEESDVAPLTTLAMALGELNFRDNIIKGKIYPFNHEIYIIFPIFALILPITVMNLMIGSAVGDINKVEKEAYLLRMKNQIAFLMSLEYAFPKSIRRKFFYYEKFSLQPNRLEGTFKGQVQKLLQNGDRIQFINKSQDNEENDELRDEIKRQSSIIENLKEVTNSIQKDLKRLTMEDESNSERSRRKSLCVNHIIVKQDKEENT